MIVHSTYHSYTFQLDASIVS